MAQEWGQVVGYVSLRKSVCSADQKGHKRRVGGGKSLLELFIACQPRYKALDSRTLKIHTNTLRFAETILASAPVTLSSAAACAAVRDSTWGRVSQIWYGARKKKTQKKTAECEHNAERKHGLTLKHGTHLVGVFWVKLCLHVLLFFLLGRLPAANGSPLPLCTFTPQGLLLTAN